MRPHDFSYSSGPEIEDAIKGKTVDGFEVPDEGMDDWLVFKFTDGTELWIRYDWIYEWYTMEAPP
jgi:hypothetical protein